MKERLITLECAKLAKEKGFNIYTEYSYWINQLKYGTPGFGNIDGTYGEYETYLEHPRYLAPTQSLLQKWIREKHEIHIEINACDDGTWRYWTVYDMPEEDEEDTGEIYATYEEALEAGLLEALNIITWRNQ